MRVFHGCFNMHIRRREAALTDFFDLQGDRQPQRRDALANGFRIDAGINERAERHIATDAAKTVEMGYSHSRASFRADSSARPRSDPTPTRWKWRVETAPVSWSRLWRNGSEQVHIAEEAIRGRWIPKRCAEAALIKHAPIRGSLRRARRRLGSVHG